MQVVMLPLHGKAKGWASDAMMKRGPFVSGSKVEMCTAKSVRWDGMETPSRTTRRRWRVEKRWRWLDREQHDGDGRGRKAEFDNGEAGQMNDRGWITVAEGSDSKVRRFFSDDKHECLKANEKSRYKRSLSALRTANCRRFVASTTYRWTPSLA